MQNRPAQPARGKTECGGRSSGTLPDQAEGRGGAAPEVPVGQNGEHEPGSREGARDDRGAAGEGTASGHFCDRRESEPESGRGTNEVPRDSWERAHWLGPPDDTGGILRGGLDARPPCGRLRHEGRPIGPSWTASHTAWCFSDPCH